VCVYVWCVCVCVCVCVCLCVYVYVEPSLLEGLEGCRRGPGVAEERKGGLCKSSFVLGVGARCRLVGSSGGVRGAVAGEAGR